MEKTNSVLEQDVAKKKKRRKRKSSVRKSDIVTVKNDSSNKKEVVSVLKDDEKNVKSRTKKEEVEKIVDNSNKSDTKEEKVTYNTFELEKLKAEISEKISYQSVPMNAFSIKNLLLTVCIVCLLTIFVVVGYCVGAFNYESKLKENEYGASHKVTGLASEIEFAGYKFYVPFGFERLDNDLSLKIFDKVEGTSIEVINVTNESVEFSESVVETNRLKFQEMGYVIYSSYILDNGMLVYSGLDTVFSDIRVVCVVNDGILYEFLVSNEYETLNDSVYDFIDEFIGR